MRRIAALPLAAALAWMPLACAGDDPLDDEDAGFPDGKADGGIDEGSPEALAVLALVNDRSVDARELDIDAALHATAAGNIIEHRDGPDGAPGTADDDPFGSLAELDAVPFVGPVALRALLAYAIEQGLIGGGEVDPSVIFSPQPAGATHTARVAALIGQAEESIDVAMYSFSDAAISAALEEAVGRGVAVRFLYESARADDRRIVGRDATRSGRLEAAGVDVRYVNKIMHHKFAIIDGPRDDAARAGSATVVTGSGNWSFGGASVYDENTMFLSGQPELAAGLQREFDLMWDHSRDFELDEPLPHDRSSADLSDDSIADHPDLELHLTSANFSVSEGSTTFRTDTSSLAVAEAWVRAIEEADESIHIASGHLRLRPVAEALIARAQQDPDLDIRVYLDQQEFISAGGDIAQQQRVEECVAAATSEQQRWDCENKSFLWGRQVGVGGIDVRYKAYSYRWDHSYAVQMHHKYMIIDGDELLSGSYNLSINAEHGTFENTLHLRGPAFAALIGAYRANFESIWDTGRPAGLLDDLRERIATDDLIPLVFEPIAVTWSEYDALRALIRQHCPAADSEEFRRNPSAHRVCPRP